MSARSPLHRRLLATATGCFLAVATVLVTASLGSAPAASAASNTTAWQNGAFSVNTAGVVSRSDVFLGQPNTQAAQSLPLGNGSLGVAAWAANGFTAQLNRSDTMPSRLSPGQVVIPGLAPMVSAANFTGTLDLYNGVLNESGGGMTMQAWVPAGKDELIVNVTGASPTAQETAQLNLWTGRSPTAAASGAIGSLGQTWVDSSDAVVAVVSLPIRVEAVVAALPPVHLGDAMTTRNDPLVFGVKATCTCVELTTEAVTFCPPAVIALIAPKV